MSRVSQNAQTSALDPDYKQCQQRAKIQSRVYHIGHNMRRVARDNIERSKGNLRDCQQQARDWVSSPHGFPAGELCLCGPCRRVSERLACFGFPVSVAGMDNNYVSDLSIHRVSSAAAATLCKNSIQAITRSWAIH